MTPRHFAAESHVDVRSSAQIHRQHHCGGTTCSAMGPAHRRRRFVHISTDEVYCSITSARSATATSSPRSRRTPRPRPRRSTPLSIARPTCFRIVTRRPTTSSFPVPRKGHPVFVTTCSTGARSVVPTVSTADCAWRYKCPARPRVAQGVIADLQPRRGQRIKPRAHRPLAGENLWPRRELIEYSRPIVVSTTTLSISIDKRRSWAGPTGDLGGRWRNGRLVCRERWWWERAQRQTVGRSSSFVRSRRPLGHDCVARFATGARRCRLDRHSSTRDREAVLSVVTTLRRPRLLASVDAVYAANRPLPRFRAMRSRRVVCARLHSWSARTCPHFEDYVFSGDKPTPMSSGRSDPHPSTVVQARWRGRGRAELPSSHSWVCGSR